MSKGKNIWLVVDHPMQIITAIGLSLYFKNDNREVHLLISKHPYWSMIQESEFAHQFTSVHWFEKAGFSKHFLREIKKIIRVRKKVKDLKIKDEDVFLVLSNKVFLEGILFSVYSKNKRIVMNPDYLLEGAIDPGIPAQYKEIVTSKIWNRTIIPFFKLQPVVHCTDPKDKGIYALFYKDGVKNVFDDYVILKPTSSEELGQKEIYDVSAYVRSVLHREDAGVDKKVIVFFGESLSDIDEYHINFTNQCLRYIEKYFPGYTYIYNPHPNDTYEARNIDSGKFEITKNRTIAELFLLKNINSVEYCFSVASSVNRHALDMGFQNVYYFFKLHEGFSDEFKNVLMKIAGEGIEPAFIKDFGSAPERYSNHISVDEVTMSLDKINKFL